MNAAMFNPLAYANKLKKAGFTEEQAEIQAEALTELIDERLATKEDIQTLQRATKFDLQELEKATHRDLQELEKSTKRDLQELEKSTKHNLQELEKSTKRDLHELEKSTKRDLHELEDRMTYKLTLRLGSMLVAAVTVLATLMKLH